MLIYYGVATIAMLSILNLFLFLGCYCAVANKWENSNMYESRHVTCAAFALFKLIYLNNWHSGSYTNDRLTSLVVYFYNYAYDLGTCCYDDLYARTTIQALLGSRNKQFVGVCTPMMIAAYNYGKEDRCNATNPMHDSRR